MPEPQALLEPLELDALYITRPENVRYLTGFPHPEDAQVLIAPEGAFLLTDTPLPRGGAGKPHPRQGPEAGGEGGPLPGPEGPGGL